MIRQLSAVAVFTAFIAALIGVLTWPGEAQQRTPSTSQSQIIAASAPPLFDQSYTAGMRIIQVPQGGVTSPRAMPKASYREEVDAIDDDVEPSPPPLQPRRVLPPANAPKRTMLNPPKSLHDGPSPVRPLPRWRGIEKFTELPKQVTPAQSITPVDSTARASDVPVIDDDTPPPTD